MEGDHSVISNFSRILNYGNDPALVKQAQDRLARLSRWKLHGEMSDHPVLAVVLRSMHDAMAYRTMPRFTFMTLEWVNSARFILSSRAKSEKYAESIKDIQFTFSEEFINTPAYAFPDGSHGGFGLGLIMERSLSELDLYPMILDRLISSQRANTCRSCRWAER